MSQSRSEGSQPATPQLSSNNSAFSLENRMKYIAECEKWRNFNIRYIIHIINEICTFQTTFPTVMNPSNMKKSPKSDRELLGENSLDLFVVRFFISQIL